MINSDSNMFLSCTNHLSPVQSTCKPAIFNPGISTPTIWHHQLNYCVCIAIAPSPQSRDANNIFELFTLCLQGTWVLAVWYLIINTVLYLPAAPDPKIALVPSVQALLLVSHLP